MPTQYDLFEQLPATRNPATYLQRYRAYLNSAQWRLISELTKELAGWKCEMCGSTENLHSHHRSYIRVFDERPGVDTMCVCDLCHMKLHGRHPLAANDNRPAKDKKTG